MIKKILITWIKPFLGVIAISYLVSLKYPEFAPKPLSFLIFSLIVAVITELIRARRISRSK